MSFFNPTSIEPYLDFRGETFLKDYRVTFSLSGRMDRLRPEFASSPPLPSEDVLALLALGESFKRTYAYEASAQMGTGSLLSFQLAEAGQEAGREALRPGQLPDRSLRPGRLHGNDRPPDGGQEDLPQRHPSCIRPT